MRFLLKLSILLLAFQVVFGKSYYQRQQEKKRKAAAMQAAAVAEANRQLRNYCNVAENFSEARCVTLRAFDAAAEEARKVAAEKLAQRKVHCASNTYELGCIHEFGLPKPWNYILLVIISIPVLLALCSV